MIVCALLTLPAQHFLPWLPSVFSLFLPCLRWLFFCFILSFLFELIMHFYPLGIVEFYDIFCCFVQTCDYIYMPPIDINCTYVMLSRWELNKNKKFYRKNKQHMPIYEVSMNMVFAHVWIKSLLFGLYLHISLISFCPGEREGWLIHRPKPRTDSSDVQGQRKFH